jgi:hypothetical protein
MDDASLSGCGKLPNQSACRDWRAAAMSTAGSALISISIGPSTSASSSRSHSSSPRFRTVYARTPRDRDVRELRPVTEGVLRIDAVCGQGVVLHAVARVIQDHHHEPQFEPDCRPEFDQPHHATAVTDHRNRGPIRAPIAAPIAVGIPRLMDPKFAACMTDCDCLTHR